MLFEALESERGTGVAQPGEAYWNGKVPLEVDSYRLQLWCFNRAERDAQQRNFERCRQERAEQGKRERAALEEARKAKAAARPPISFEKLPTADPAIHDAFEQLRQKAEAQVETHEGTDAGLRRPSWAPPLIFGDELTQTCRSLGWLGAEDKPIGRLWAIFATPKRSGRYVREHLSTLPLSAERAPQVRNR